MSGPRGECDLAVGKLELNTTQRAVAVPGFDAFIEKLLETNDPNEPAFVLAIERFEELTPFFRSDFASFHASPFR